jgi:hypothetical protein
MDNAGKLGKKLAHSTLNLHFVLRVNGAIIGVALAKFLITPIRA